MSNKITQTSKKNIDSIRKKYKSNINKIKNSEQYQNMKTMHQVESSKSWKQHFEEVLKTKKSANSIALGFAIGTLIGTLPIPFIDFFIGIIIILIFKRINKFSLMLGIFVWNPLTKIPVYSLSYQLGNYLFSEYSLVQFKFVFLNLAYNYTRRFLVGNLIISVVLTIACYLIIYLLVILYKKLNKNE